jgi:hypothetical protein
MPMIHLSRSVVAKSFVSLLSVAATWLGLTSVAEAQSTIRQPGQHTRYSFELEPHLAIDWLDAHWAGEGIGPGVHFAIPIMHQGPISTINNNMAIKFGADLTFGNGCYYYDRRWIDNYYRDCSSTSLMMPIALQWNFYVTDLIVPFAEIGMAIRSTWYSYAGPCGNGVCSYDSHDIYPLFYLVGGAKFMFGRNIGLTVRMGYPHITVGASFLF